MQPPSGPLVWYITAKRPVVNSGDYKPAQHGAVLWWCREKDAAWTRAK